MRGNVTWCLVCSIHNTGRATRPPLTRIPVAGSFDQMGVDVIVSSVTPWESECCGFKDYNQMAGDLWCPIKRHARLLVQQIISRHGVPTEILSDHVKAG